MIKKKIKAPDGYIYNRHMCLCGWPWAQRRLKAADAELARKYKIDTAENPQDAYDKFCAAYWAKWHEEAPTESRED